MALQLSVRCSKDKTAHALTLQSACFGNLQPANRDSSGTLMKLSVCHIYRHDTPDGFHDDQRPRLEVSARGPHTRTWNKTVVSGLLIGFPIGCIQFIAIKAVVPAIGKVAASSLLI
jgi:hypothetical protein